MSTMENLSKESKALIQTQETFNLIRSNKMAAKLLLGFTYWDKREELSDEELIERLEKNIKDKDWVDVANLANFLWHRTQIY